MAELGGAPTNLTLSTAGCGKQLFDVKPHQVRMRIFSYSSCRILYSGLNLPGFLQVLALPAVYRGCSYDRTAVGGAGCRRLGAAGDPTGGRLPVLRRRHRLGDVEAR